jgi:hypothetical protein
MRGHRLKSWYRKKVVSGVVEKSCSSATLCVFYLSPFRFASFLIWTAFINYSMKWKRSTGISPDCTVCELGFTNLLISVFVTSCSFVFPHHLVPLPPLCYNFTLSVRSFEDSKRLDIFILSVKFLGRSFSLFTKFSKEKALLRWWGRNWLIEDF